MQCAAPRCSKNCWPTKARLGSPAPTKTSSKPSPAARRCSKCARAECGRNTKAFFVLWDWERRGRGGFATALRLHNDQCLLVVDFLLTAPPFPNIGTSRAFYVATRRRRFLAQARAAENRVGRLR